MIEAAQKPEKQSRTHLDKSLRLQAATYYAQGFTPIAIAKKVGVNVNTINTWRNRYKWVAIRCNTEDDLRVASEKAVQFSLASASERLKRGLSNELEATLGAVQAVPQKGTLRGAKERLEVIEPISRVAKTVFDWGQQEQLGLIMVGQIESNTPDSEVIDVDSSQEQLPNAVQDDAGPANPV